MFREVEAAAEVAAVLCAEEAEPAEEAVFREVEAAEATVFRAPDAASFEEPFTDTLCDAARSDEAAESPAAVPEAPGRDPPAAEGNPLPFTENALVAAVAAIPAAFASVIGFLAAKAAIPIKERTTSKSVILRLINISKERRTGRPRIPRIPSEGCAA